MNKILVDSYLINSLDSEISLQNFTGISSPVISVCEKFSGFVSFFVIQMLIILFNPFGKNELIIVHFAKNSLAKRSFSSKIKFNDIMTQSFASLPAFSFAKLSYFQRNLSGKLISHFTNRGFIGSLSVTPRRTLTANQDFETIV